MLDLLAYIIMYTPSSSHVPFLDFLDVPHKYQLPTPDLTHINEFREEWNVIAKWNLTPFQNEIQHDRDPVGMEIPSLKFTFHQIRVFMWILDFVSVRSQEY